MADWQTIEHSIALTLLPGIGPGHAKNLIAHCGSPEAVWREKKQVLAKIPGIGPQALAAISQADTRQRAEAEIAFIQKQGLQAHYFLDDSYPRRMRQCEDGPLILYQKGTAELNKNKVIAVVGTRNATHYGEELTEQLLADMVPYRPLVLSGLAYGIDIMAHKQALRRGLPTVAVLAHGLDQVYPSLHRKVVEEMQTQEGGVVSEFISGTKPERSNFPMRNRIIAGMADAVVVVEAAKKGGALITAQLANSYHRDVFACPGRLNDTFSEGCNDLIKTNQASLLNSVKDFEYLLNWKKGEKRTENIQQTALFYSLSTEEQALCQALQRAGGEMALELLCLKLEKPVHQVLTLLMNLELQDMVHSKPGKIYGLTSSGKRASN